MRALGHAGTRKRVGDAIGADCKVVIVRMRCACGTMQEEPCEANAPLKKQLAETTCMFCGALGQMTKERT